MRWLIYVFSLIIFWGYSTADQKVNRNGVYGTKLSRIFEDWLFVSVNEDTLEIARYLCDKPKPIRVFESKLKLEYKKHSYEQKQGVLVSNKQCHISIDKNGKMTLQNVNIENNRTIYLVKNKNNESLFTKNKKLLFLDMKRTEFTEKYGDKYSQQYDANVLSRMILLMDTLSIIDFKKRHSEFEVKFINTYIK